MIANEIAVITMVRDDEFYIKKWVSYYGEQFGIGNLFVILHGRSQNRVDDWASQCSVLRIPARGPGDTVGRSDFNRDRADLVAGMTRGLLKYYKVVIYVDVDEFIVVDPRVGLPLRDYIISLMPFKVLSPFGLDVVHRPSVEPETLRPDVPILEQRRACRIASRYTKPSIVTVPVRWGGGFHSSTHYKLNIPKGLYMFHLKWVDRALALNTHLSREQNKGGREGVVMPKMGLQAPDQDYTHRKVVESAFEMFDHMELIAEFDFDFERKRLERSWRPRAFVFHLSFWKSVFSRSQSYVLYWQFRGRDSNKLFLVPSRFYEVL